jgi:hypothetical protein
MAASARLAGHRKKSSGFRQRDFFFLTINTIGDFVLLASQVAARRFQFTKR